MAAGADARHQRLGRHPLDRLLAGRIDRRHDDRVGIVEAGGELVEQVAQAGEAMRLGDGDDRGPCMASRAAFSTALISTG